MGVPHYWEHAKAHLCAADPILASVIQAYHGEEGVHSRGDAFETLIRSVVGQQISVKAADAVWGRLAHAYDIIPSVLQHAEEDTLRGCGLSRPKIKYIHGIAAAFSAGDMHVTDWHDWPDEEVMAELITLPGIGRWTAEMFLMFHRLRPDVLPVQDLGLQKAFEKHYAQPRTALIKHAPVWQPYRSVATWYLWRSLDPVPVAY